MQPTAAGRWARTPAATIVLALPRPARDAPSSLLCCDGALGPLARLTMGIERLCVAMLDDAQRAENYARHADADGWVSVMTLAVRVLPSAWLLATPQAQEEASAQLDPAAATVVRLGVPLTVLLGSTPGRTQLELGVRIAPHRIDCVADGRILNSEWPTGRWLAGSPDAALTIAPGVRLVRAEPQALSDAELGWEEDVDPPMRQHWTPQGHNAWAGDTMWCATPAALHLFWLADRRGGVSKQGCGAHQFAHHVTADLVHWSRLPLAYAIDAPEELSQGTAAIIADAGALHLYARHCHERLGPEHAARFPGGLHHAVSRDGVRFERVGRCPIVGQGRTVHDLGHEIGIVRDDDGLWHAAAAATRLVSSDLHAWQVADAAFLPPVGWPVSRAVTSNECANWFAWRGWHYLILGRTGFWRARSLTGPYWGPGATACAWDPYDGLMVPQAVVWRDRCLLAGWLARERQYAGTLVFRELLQQPDGELALRRLPELEPVPGPPRAWQGEDAPDCRWGASGLTLMAGTAWRCAWIAGVGADVRIRARVRCRGARHFGLRLLGKPGGAATELAFEPGRARAQVAHSQGASSAAEPPGMPCDGGDFAILGVTGLDEAFTIDVLVRAEPKSGSWIVDAAIDERRTLISRRVEAPGDAIGWWCDGGTLEVDALEIRPLPRLPG